MGQFKGPALQTLGSHRASAPGPLNKYCCLAPLLWSQASVSPRLFFPFPFHPDSEAVPFVGTTPVRGLMCNSTWE